MNNKCNDRNVQINTPFSISKLNRCFSESEKSATDKLPKCTDTSQAEVNDTYHIPWYKCTVNGKRVVSKMPLDVFQQYLVEHFDIRFKQNDIVWPCRINKPIMI